MIKNLSIPCPVGRCFSGSSSRLRVLIAVIFCLVPASALFARLQQSAAGRSPGVSDPSAYEHESRLAAGHLDPSEDSIFTLGCDLLLHANYESATQAFAAGIARYPDSSRMELGMGISAYARGNYNQAMDSFLKASDLDPSAAVPYEYLGKVYALVSQRAEAIAERLHRFVELFPDNAQANYDYAMSLRKERRNTNSAAAPAQIEPLLERAIALDPKFADPHLQLGIFYAEQSDFEKAADEYRQAIKLDSDLVEAHNRLGQALARLGNHSAAQQETQIYEHLHHQQLADADRARREIRQLVLTIHYPSASNATPQQATSSSPAPKPAIDDAAVQFSDSAALKPGGISGSVDAGGYSSAAEGSGKELRTALGEIQPAGVSGGTSVQAEAGVFEQGKSLLIQGHYEQASKLFQQGAGLYPQSAKLLLGLGVADYSSGHYAEAISALCKAVDLSPLDRTAYFFLAQTYSASPSGTNQVLDRLANYAKLRPGDAAAQYYYAVALWRSRSAGGGPVDPVRVADILRSAIKLDPTLAEAHYQLGVVLTEQGDDPQAVAEFERAIALQPNFAEAHYRAAQLFERAGQKEKAQAELAEYDRLRKQAGSQDERLRDDVRRLLLGKGAS